MAVPQNPTFTQIRERAYELWERNHRPDGLEVQLWLAAERELRAEMRADLPPDGPAADVGGGAKDRQRHGGTLVEGHGSGASRPSNAVSS
ncbi:DUF2934 domain-containing protein [Methylobacterium oryzae]|uniref:DUF2934 domain-containing protein n=1 Tax=Methylobacterium oryzae TaxID=334852 RepID=UPI002F31727A